MRVKNVTFSGQVLSWSILPGTSVNGRQDTGCSGSGWLRDKVVATGDDKMQSCRVVVQIFALLVSCGKLMTEAL